MKKLSLLMVCAVLAFVPTAAQADHCADILVFTGYTDALADAPQTSGSINPGAAGCTAPEAHADTNYILPGATFVLVGAVGVQSQTASLGAIKFDDGAFENFTFVYSAPRGRWVSPFFPIPAGTTQITARGRTTNDEAPKTETVVYNVLA